MVHKRIILSFFLSIFFTSLASAAVVEDKDLVLKAMPDCPPPRGLPTEIMEEDGTISVRPAYVSEQAGITSYEEPPYESFKDPYGDNQKKVATFAIRMLQMAEGREFCDPIGIKYAAKFYRYFCPTLETYRRLNPHAKIAVDQFFDNFNEPIFKRAKAVSGCLLK